MPGNMQKMMQQAQKMQEQLQQQIAEIRVEASTGGGMVTVKMDGHKKVLSLAIEPDAMEDREMLQDMIRGAVNEAAKRVDDEAQGKMGGMLGGMGLPPGLI
jgi:DNA-binding YbaB/EbfC family protein